MLNSLLLTLHACWSSCYWLYTHVDLLATDSTRMLIFLLLTWLLCDSAFQLYILSEVRLLNFLRLCDRWLVFFHPDIFRRFNVIGIVHVYGHGQPLLQQFRETLVPHLDFMVMGPWVLGQAKHLKRLTPRYAVSKETLEELQNKQHSALQWSYCSVRLGQWTIFVHYIYLCVCKW